MKTNNDKLRHPQTAKTLTVIGTLKSPCCVQEHTKGDYQRALLSLCGGDD